MTTSIAGRAKRVIQDATLSPMIVRFTQGVGTNATVYDPGQPYHLPAGQAREYIACGFAVEISDPADVAFAEQQIRQREAIA